MSFTSAIDGILGGQIGSMFVGRGEMPAGTAARDEYRRQQRLNAVKRSQWEQLERAELDFGRYFVTHTPTGRRFRVNHGLLDGTHTGVSAYSMNAAGDVIALEPL